MTNNSQIDGHREPKVAHAAVHRLVEFQAVLHGDAPAILEGECVTTYRDLNSQANAIARCLMTHGFRRGAHAIVRLPRGRTLPVVLLSILKAGGSYTWMPLESTADIPMLSIGDAASDLDDCFRALDVDAVLADVRTGGPNLPILTRGADLACVLRQSDGGMVTVPHAMIAGLHESGAVLTSPWVSDDGGDVHGALDLWMALMAGDTITVAPPSSALAA